jgi:hypothetical protein
MNNNVIEIDSGKTVVAMYYPFMDKYGFNYILKFVE